MHPSSPSLRLLRSLRLIKFSVSSVPLCALCVIICHVSPASPIRPLAQKHIVLDRSPDYQHIPLYTPSILALPNGRLLAANERGGAAYNSGENFTRLYYSDDHGLSWKLSATAKIWHGRLFSAGKSIYYLGHRGDLQIMRSDDNGSTWSPQIQLTQDHAWHQSACNVIHANGNIYLVMELVTQIPFQGWASFAPILMRAKETDDLTQSASWSYSNGIAMQNAIPGFKDNNPQLEYFGVPFYPMTYPVINEIAPGRSMWPMGWGETNIAQIKDPNHYWFDPTGKTFHLLMRTQTGTTNYAALLKITEKPDGSMQPSFQLAPSGKKLVFIQLPGGHLRFHLLHDPKSNLFWLLSNQGTDSLTRPDKLPPERFDLAYNQRQRLVLHFSKNLLDWCFAGVVAIAESDRASRHYASMDIDGDDLVILSRSGDANAKNAHEGNLITFHRIKNFRDLIY
jgi:hypothetical protein